MTPEERLQRLERIAKLFVKAGRRTRREVRDHENKIRHLVDLQIRTEDLQKRTDESFAKLAESQAYLRRRFDKLADEMLGRNNTNQ